VKTKANYRVEGGDHDFVFIVDQDEGCSVTHDASAVVASLNEDGYLKNDRRVFYVDTDGHIDELLHRQKRFVGFKSGTASEDVLGRIAKMFGYYDERVA